MQCQKGKERNITTKIIAKTACKSDKHSLYSNINKHNVTVFQCVSERSERRGDFIRRAQRAEYNTTRETRSEGGEEKGEGEREKEGAPQARPATA